MTYKQIKARINALDKRIAFMYEVQKEKQNSGNREAAIICGDIINNLCSYKNYLIYEKQYEVVDTTKTNKAAKSALRYESMIGDFSKDGRDLKLQTEKEFCEAMTELADDLIRNETSI